MPGYIGQPLRRFEDERFITGTGRYTADIAVDGEAHAVFVRSPHAHAAIARIGIEAAASCADVLGVYTAADLVAAGIRPVPSLTRTPPYRFANADGSEMADASQYPLATDRVRYAGEPVVMVVAQTRLQALDAAERVEIDYEVLPAAATLEQALAPDAQRLWPELEDNRSCHWEKGDAAAVDAVFAAAAHTVEIEVAYPRRIIAFMEPRAALARFERDTERFVLETGCQSAHWMRDGLALVLDVAGERVRVIVPDTGGGFGARAIVYPEFVCALHGARALGRPVKWVAERTEAFVSDAQARSQRITAALAMDADGRFEAVRMAATWCHGGYLAPRSMFVVLNAMPPMVCGAYRIAHQHFRLDGVFTNTTPIASFRAVGRAEAGYAIERLVDKAARTLRLSPVELRRRNLIAPHEMPYPTATGLTYERAEFARNMDRALAAIDIDGLAARRGAARRRGRLCGIGIATYVMSAGGAPQEHAEVAVEADGGVVVAAGTQDFGMGHETVFAQLAADLLGVDPACVRVVYGDTDKIPAGQGGHGSRCMRIGGSVIAKAAETVIEQGRTIAGEILEADAGDIRFANGRFEVAGTDRAVSLANVAQTAQAHGARLAAHESYTVDGPAFPNGCHACEVEVDPQTGHVTLTAFVTVVDPGRVINPLLVEGQMHGGVVQGIGEAMAEAVVYGEDSAQLLSGSFMDYQMPRADELPHIATLVHPIDSAGNPLGVKGVGEAGTMTTPAAIVNAVLDALAETGVTAIDMPLTPERVWRAVAKAQSRSRAP
jgi:carbon-monoxide dehydrogenase large subunit